MVFTRQLQLSSQAKGDVLDITAQVQKVVEDSNLQAGVVTIFCPGSTGSLTTIEYESGAISDFKQILNELIPYERDYQHHRRWGDDNGAAHVRAALMGPSLSIPFAQRRLMLGTWQQIVFINFDTRPRSRQIIVQVMGE